MFKLIREQLNQPGQNIDRLIRQDNQLIFPTHVADSTVEGGSLRFMSTKFGYPYLLWGQCLLDESPVLKKQAE